MPMRGGTSKGAYSWPTTSPPNRPSVTPAAADHGSSRPAPQIDRPRRRPPLTSKVAVVSPSADPEADVDYLFLQVGVDTPEVSDRQNCGNLLAGRTLAVERGWSSRATDTSVRIRMVNTGDSRGRRSRRAAASTHRADAEISGAPGARPRS